MYDEIKLTNFKAYFVFPKIEKYEWNEYLVIGLVNTFFSEKYNILRINGENIVRRMKNEL